MFELTQETLTNAHKSAIAAAKVLTRKGVKSYTYGPLCLMEDKEEGLLYLTPSDSVPELYEWVWEELGEDSSEDTELHALEDALCNGWEHILPEEIGALTDRLIISYDTARDQETEDITELGAAYIDDDPFMQLYLYRILTQGYATFKRII